MPELTPKQKRQARIITLQIIYAHELNGSNIDDTCEFMLDKRNPPIMNVIKYELYCLFYVSVERQMNSTF